MHDTPWPGTSTRAAVAVRPRCWTIRTCSFSPTWECASSHYQLIEGYRWFACFYEWWSDACFILNTRHVDDWIRSRVNHGEGRYLPHYRKHYGGVSEETVINRWRAQWYQHHYEMMAFSSDKPGQLLAFDIDRDRPGRLVKFLDADFSLNPRFYRHAGNTKTKESEPASELTPDMTSDSGVDEPR